MSKILLVEDDIILRDMYHDKFVHEGFEVVIAGDGEEAIDKLQTTHPSVMILDLMMPKKTGFGVLEWIRNVPEFKKVKIIVLTNILADAEDLVKNWGVKYFMIKSEVTPEDVAKKVQYLLTPRPKVV